MFKFLFTVLNFLSLANYQIIKEPSSYQNIMYEDNNYLIYEEESKLKLKANDDAWIRELEIATITDCFNIDGKLYIFSYSKYKLNVYVYNLDGERVAEKIIFENKVSNLKIRYNNNFYLVGSVSEKEAEIFADIDREGLGKTDGFIIELDIDLEIKRVEIFGGKLNDEIYNLCFMEEKIVITGKKDILTGGDFGNGGRSDGVIFVALLSSNLQILDTIVFNDTSKIVDLVYFKDNIYLTSEEYLYKISHDFKLSLSNKIPTNAICFKAAFVNKLIIFSKNHLYIYDSISLRKLDEINFDYDLNSIQEFNNILYSEDHYYDLASLEGLKYIDPLYSGVIPSYDVETLFGKCEFLNELSDPVFDSLVFGTYERKLKYKNSYGLEFILEFKSRVLVETNVSEGGIYPLGYNLRFTGRGYLNAEAIQNNYSITKPGNYSLRLVGLDDEYIINFKVDEGQIAFQEESVIDYHNLTRVNENYYITLKYDEELENIKSVLIDDIEYSDLIINKDQKSISVKMPRKSVPGVYYHQINGINYEEAEVLRTKQINQVYVVNVRKNELALNIEKLANNEYFVEVYDDNTLRYFVVTYYLNGKEYIYKYSINSNKIILNNLPSKTVNIKLGVCYDLGDKSYQRFDLLDIEYSNLSNVDLEIDVIKKEESLKEFKVTLNNQNEISKIMLKNEVVFENIIKDYTPHIIFGLVLFGVFFLIIYKIRYSKFKKREV